MSDPEQPGDVDAPSKPYTFRLSLRLRHPLISADEISKALNAEPRRKWTVGEQRSSPNGTPLKGLNQQTYWTQRIINDDSSNLIAELWASVENLETHKEFLRNFVETGGNIEYFIGWFTTDVSGGDTFDWELMQRLADLRINLSFDVYGSKI